MSWIYEEADASGLSEQCLRNNRENPQNCMYASYNLPFINQRIPLFIFQSRFDSWQVKHLLSIDVYSGGDHDTHNINLNVTNTDLINRFGDHLYQSLLYKVHTRQIDDEATLKSNYGVFLESCFHHVGYYNEIEVANDTEATSLYEFWDSRFGMASNRVAGEQVQEGEHLPGSQAKYQTECLQKMPYPCNQCCASD